MIKYIKGDIFTSSAQVLVNPVNTMGIMGKGLAGKYKTRYPKMFFKYQSACKKGLLIPGKLMLVRESDYLILLFPTKTDWRNPSKLEYIEAGLYKLACSYVSWGIHSIAFPKLGCGNGGLDWENVKPIIEK